MAISNKLEQLRNKNEQEKHAIAVVGSVVFTLVVILVWGYTFINTLGSNIVSAKNEEYNEQFSPLSSLKNLFSDSIQKVKVGGGVLKDSASVIFGGGSTSQ